jgi:Cu+-exporting ATPase
VFVPTVMVIAVATVIIWLTVGGDGARVRAMAAGCVGAHHRVPVRDGARGANGGDGATGRSSELGVLVKGGEALQRTGEVTAVVLDKTAP